MSLEHFYSIEQDGDRFWVLRDGKRVAYSNDIKACAEYIRSKGGECVQLSLF